MKKIITISREFGAGGGEIGKKVADILKYEFYDKELEQRRILKYPPYYHVLRVVIVDEKLEKVTKNSKDIYATLQKKIPKNTIIIAPSDPLRPKIRKKYRKYIIIKIKNDKDTDRNYNKVREVIRSLPAYCSVENDPLGTL